MVMCTRRYLFYVIMACLARYTYIVCNSSHCWAMVKVALLHLVGNKAILLVDYILLCRIIILYIYDIGRAIFYHTSTTSQGIMCLDISCIFMMLVNLTNKSNFLKTFPLSNLRKSWWSTKVKLCHLIQLQNQSCRSISIF